MTRNSSKFIAITTSAVASSTTSTIQDVRSTSVALNGPRRIIWIA